jgi:hypothetical protein
VQGPRRPQGGGEVKAIEASLGMSELLLQCYRVKKLTGGSKADTHSFIIASGPHNLFELLRPSDSGCSDAFVQPCAATRPSQGYFRSLLGNPWSSYRGKSGRAERLHADRYFLLHSMPPVAPAAAAITVLCPPQLSRKGSQILPRAHVHRPGDGRHREKCESRASGERH